MRITDTSWGWSMTWGGGVGLSLDRKASVSLLLFSRTPLDKSSTWLQVRWVVWVRVRGGEEGVYRNHRGSSSARPSRVRQWQTVNRGLATWIQKRVSKQVPSDTISAQRCHKHAPEGVEAGHADQQENRQPANITAITTPKPHSKAAKNKYRIFGKARTHLTWRTVRCVS